MSRTAQDPGRLWLSSWASSGLLPCLLLVVGFIGCWREPPTADPWSHGIDAGQDTASGGDADSDTDADADADGDADADADTSSCMPDAGDHECNYVDDDCDGQTDEDVDTAQDPTNCGYCGWECTYPTVEFDCEDGECVAAECDWPGIDWDEDGICDEWCVPVAEEDLCNGVDLQDTDNPYQPLDDDCDQLYDEDEDFESDPLNCGWCGHECEYEGAAALCQDAVCVMGDCDELHHDINESDTDGCEIECAPISADEECNGLDDDCNGMVDELFPEQGLPCFTADSGCSGAPFTCVGSCAPGIWACPNGSLYCEGEIIPVFEQDNGLDDDCDGDTDETDCAPPETLPCGSDAGACEQGAHDCILGYWGECEGGVGPVDETCNGLDDDCDGETDELPDLEGWPCGGSLGICEAGLTECVCDSPTSCAIECVGNVTGEDESCNLLDDDCDGFTDEELASGSTCSSSQTDDPNEGVCFEGEFVCVNGDWECNANLAMMEICDGKDNDCDGLTDEGLECGDW